MSVEELLTPRFKVILDYPTSSKYFKTGDILFCGNKDRGEFGWVNEERTCGMHLDTLKAYPHIFKPMEWWEEREQSNMPKYVRYHGAVALTAEHEFVITLGIEYNPLPATEEHYNEYQSTKINPNK